MGPAMDYAACNVVYLDRRAGGDRLIKRGDVLLNDALVDTAQLEEELASVQRDALLLNSNLETLLGTFSEGKTHLP
jgi:3',5'-cyclic-nucleotide phosphodiesterase